jgi:hypothetical protein
MARGACRHDREVGAGLGRISAFFLRFYCFGALPRPLAGLDPFLRSDLPE